MLVERFVWVVHVIHRRAQFTRKRSKMLEQTRNRHGVFKRELVTRVHATKFGNSTGTLRGGNDYRTESAMKSKPNPENAGAALSLCRLRHA